jgi:acyl-CoA reductase-like NAD-dependent aldehyde dehydrogenase
VHESVADEYISILIRETSQLQASHQPNSDKRIRGLFTPASAKRVNGLVGDALSKGANIVVGDEALAGKQAPGNLVQPVILDNVTQEMGGYMRLFT